MAFEAPDLSAMREVAGQLGLDLTDTDLGEFRELMADVFAAYAAVDAMPDYVPEVRYPREAGYRPEGDENKYGAWYVKTTVRGAPEGPLAGRTVVLKDSICLAGVPMAGGTSILEGYVPEVDATIVTRILDAGGVIAGKAVCENFCVSGGSHTCAQGPTLNPRNPAHTTGGSSSGCAALVAAGEVEMAIGGDQGGSIRLPSSFSGIYGLKPTHGLVPYSGIMSIESTFDHAGPMTASVQDNALLLEVIAGPDGIDGRQMGVGPEAYTEATGMGAAGLRIAVVEEGFGTPSSEPEVDAKVLAAAARFRELGAEVEEVSIPMHLAGAAIFFPIAAEGAVRQMMWDYGFGQNQEGLAVLSLRTACEGWRERTGELPETLQLFMLMGQYGLWRYRGRYYAKGANLRRQLRAAYDDVLSRFDLLLMPTTPMVAPPLPPPDAPRAVVIQRGLEMFVNTQQFDITGHPAMSLPCGMSGDLPVGLMLVGGRYREGTIYRAAWAFEQSEDWQKM
ncbi:MAG: amidase [Gemmatimonadales bacterium]